jgi:hypothetical protein
VTLPTYHVDSAIFQLVASEPSGAEVQSTLTVTVECPYTYFFESSDPETDACPLAEATFVQAAFRPFERGYMIWREDTGTVYVLSTEGTPALRRYQDTWTEGEAIPEIDEAPPEGLYIPDRGLGKVWAENPSVRQMIGWSTAAEEIGYPMQVQQSGAFKYPRSYFTWPVDGRVLYVVENDWGFVDP